MDSNPNRFEGAAEMSIAALQRAASVQRANLFAGWSAFAGVSRNMLAMQSELAGITAAQIGKAGHYGAQMLAAKDCSDALRIHAEFVQSTIGDSTQVVGRFLHAGEACLGEDGIETPVERYQGVAKA